MALNIDEKKAIVVEVNETARKALSLVIADARGVNVSDLTVLRRQARENKVNLRVVKNTLAKRAFKGTSFECVEGELSGPSLFGFSMEDPGAAARVFKEFAKGNERFDIKALSISGQLLGKEQIDALATLPTLQQALGQLASVMLAPVIQLVRTLNEVPTKVTRAVAAVGDKKHQSAA